MKDRLLGGSFRTGMLSALLVAAGMILSLQGCVLPPPGRVIVQAPPPALPVPPFLYVIPGTYAYFVADVDVDIFFYQGFWYRPYLGRWYRANDYNGPWAVIVIDRVPLILRQVPPTYRRVAPPSGRLPYNDVRNNWRTWERERYWDRHDERKRERYEQEDRGREHSRDNDRDRNNGRGGDRDEYRDNRRDSGPQHQPPQPQEQRQNRYQDRNENRDKDKDKDRGRDRDEYRDNRRDSGPQSQPLQSQEPQVQHQAPPQPEDRQGQIKEEDRRGGKGMERDVRRGQEGPSEPVRQLTQPQVQQQQEKKETPQKKQQDRKKDKGREKDKNKDSAASQDGNDNGRDEQGQGKKKDR